MAGFTNRGKYRIVAEAFTSGAAGFQLSSGYYLHLCTSGNIPDADTNTLTGLTQIVPGNGYSETGRFVPRSTIGFTGTVEDDTLDFGYVVMQNVVFTAAGGTLPAGGSGISFAVLTNTGDVAGNRDVLCYWNLSGQFYVSDAQTFTVQNGRLALTE